MSRRGPSPPVNVGEPRGYSGAARPAKPPDADEDEDVGGYPVPRFGPQHSSSYGPSDIPVLCGSRTSSSLNSCGGVWGGGETPTTLTASSPFLPHYPPLAMSPMTLMATGTRPTSTVQHGGDGGSGSSWGPGARSGGVEQGAEKKVKEDTHSQRAAMHRATAQLLQAARQADEEDKAAFQHQQQQEDEDEEPPSLGDLRKRRSSQGSSGDGMLVSGWSLANISINSSTSNNSNGSMSMADASASQLSALRGGSLGGSLGLGTSLVFGDAEVDTDVPLGSPSRIFTSLSSVGSNDNDPTGPGEDRGASPAPFVPVLDPRDADTSSVFAGPPLASRPSPPPPPLAFTTTHTSDGTTTAINSMTPRYPPMPPASGAAPPAAGDPRVGVGVGLPSTGAFRPLPSPPPMGWAGALPPPVPHFSSPYLYHSHPHLAVAARSVSSAMPLPPRSPSPTPPPPPPGPPVAPPSGSQRGSYKCGRCGGPKRNHVCPMLVDKSTKHVAVQVDREVTVGHVSGGAAAGSSLPQLPCPPFRLLTVTPRPAAANPPSSSTKRPQQQVSL